MAAPSRLLQCGPQYNAYTSADANTSAPDDFYRPTLSAPDQYTAHGTPPRERPKAATPSGRPTNQQLSKLCVENNKRDITANLQLYGL